jgi:drug/metabolite transporter (DMT)-like permease
MGADRVHRGEQLGFLAVGAFVLCASVRDVYFAKTFQAHSPLHVAAIAFSLCTVIFLIWNLARGPANLRALRRWPRELLAINATSAVGWICFFYALRGLEPSLVQIVWAGSGPLTITALERLGIALAAPTRLRLGERICQAGILIAIVTAAAVAVTGLSATGPHEGGVAWLGVALALVSGVSITVNALLCKRLNERQVKPEALLSVRFVGVVIVALAPFTPTSAAWSADTASTVALAALLLIVGPLYLNQLGISLASPMTVRVVHALGPVLVFLLQVLEGRLPASAYSLAAIVLYSTSTVAAAVARQWLGGGKPAAEGFRLLGEGLAEARGHGRLLG